MKNTLQVRYGSEIIIFSLKRLPKPHRKVTIQVKPQGDVLVDAPENASDQKIKEAVTRKARWILKNLKEFRRLEEMAQPRMYVSGESYFYLGRRFVLKVFSGNQINSVKLLGGEIQIHCLGKDAEDRKKLMQEWYRDHALEYFQKRIDKFSTELPWLTEKETPLDFQLRKMKNQWGSCSPKGMILLNPHLVKAARTQVDYVILHELCHLQSHDHGPKFYSLLDNHMPNWKLLRDQLDSMASLYVNE